MLVDIYANSEVECLRSAPEWLSVQAFLGCSELYLRYWSEDLRVLRPYARGELGLGARATITWEVLIGNRRPVSQYDGLVDQPGRWSKVC